MNDTIAHAYKYNIKNRIKNDVCACVCMRAHTHQWPFTQTNTNVCAHSSWIPEEKIVQIDVVVCGPHLYYSNGWHNTFTCLCINMC